MTACAEDEPKFQVAADKVGLPISLVVPDRSDLSVGVDQEDALGKRAGDLQGAILDELTLSHASRPEQGRFAEGDSDPSPGSVSAGV